MGIPNEVPLRAGELWLQRWIREVVSRPWERRQVPQDEERRQVFDRRLVYAVQEGY
jgi:hypothetical protein